MIKHKTIPVEAAVPAAILNTAQATRPFGYRSGQALPLQRRGTAGFTLAELVVTVVVLVLLVLLFTQLLNTAATVTTLGHKKMGADSEARQLLDRMAIDFAQMVKRSDVDFFGKGTVAGGAMTGNDQIAFYSAVPGYYPQTGSQSPVSLVAYRINSVAGTAAWFGMGYLRPTPRSFSCHSQFQQLGRLRPAVRHLTVPTKWSGRRSSGLNIAICLLVVVFRSRRQLMSP